MVLHVAGALLFSGEHIAFKFTEDLLVGFADDISEDVKATPMWHADNNFLHMMVGGNINNAIHHRDEGFRAFEGEAFLPHIFCLEERLKCLCRNKSSECEFLILVGERSIRILHIGTDPFTLLIVKNIGVLDSHFSAIGTAENCHDVTQFHTFMPG